MYHSSILPTLCQYAIVQGMEENNPPLAQVPVSESKNPSFISRRFKLITVMLATALIASGATYAILNLQNKPPTQPQPITTQPSSPTSNPDQTVNWKTYKNNAYGFEFKHPPDWSMKAFNDDTYFIFGPSEAVENATSLQLNHGWNTGLSIDIYKNPHKIEDLEREGIDETDNPNSPKPLNKYSYEKINLGGLSANKRVSLSEEEYILFPHTYITLNANDHGWSVMFPNTDYEGNHYKGYDQILSTFKFN